jgi:WhiB family transcriptional regulator, redox-sensing transcriptional regulator
MAKKIPAPKALEVPLPDFSQGACAHADPDVFFDDVAEERDDVTPLVFTYCHIKCPIRPECLHWAMVTNQKHGMWGGTTPRQRMKLQTPIIRVSCPGCHGTDIMEMPTAEMCLSCGLTWKI